MTIDYGSTGKQIEVWVRISGWGIPQKVGTVPVVGTLPATMRSLARFLRVLADAIDEAP